MRDIYQQIKLLKNFDAVIPAIKSSDTIILNGTSAGGRVGDWLEIIDIQTNIYSINGCLSAAATADGGSAPANPFSAAV